MLNRVLSNVWFWPVGGTRREKMVKAFSKYSERIQEEAKSIFDAVCNIPEEPGGSSKCSEEYEKKMKTSSR
jgi:hypothetical protein